MVAGGGGSLGDRNHRIMEKHHGVPEGTPEECHKLSDHEMIMVASSAVPSGRVLMLHLDPVVPGLITGLHHRLPSNVPPGRTESHFYPVERLQF